MLVSLLAVLLGRVLPAQGSEAGASFLLVPIGARLVATGGANVADPSGTVGFLSNPGAFARLVRRDASFEVGLDDVSERYVATVAVPSRVLGTVALSGYLYNAGSFEVTDENGTVVGNAGFRDVTVAASYAARFGRRLHAGITYKYTQYRFDCTGICERPGDPEQLSKVKPSTSALDLGAQFDPRPNGPVHFGIVLRNLGQRLQVRDRAQADPLPTQLAAGVAYDVPNVARYVPDATLRIMTEATTGLGARLDETYHVGAEATYRRAFALRAGYGKRSDGYSGPAIGFGLMRARFTLDVARQIAPAGFFADKPPTYVGLRYAF